WLDPYSKPPEFANNMHYDGVVGQADEQNDIISAFLFGADGYNQQQQRIALDARKGGTRSINKLASDAIQKDPALYADPVNLQALIEDLTDQVMRADHGSGPISTVYYRSVLRLVRDRLVVVGQRGGQRVVLS